ncbi:MFS transporter [Devosia psychrophila]|uniref:MFS transporter n=1 Tax=Devosia psychrophila TaxID=728005 RepID=A0A0F5PUE9_9HYPH|nr:MFS transporter [Devosia psychrophila]KKC32327.1 MFS transporter [Devosia psychrophila]SFD29273.1 MFS transporter, putative metabolite:H+ symporter [Devosia psychrophila]
MLTVDGVLERAGAGRFQWRLLGIFGLVWAADAMQVLAVGFTSASIAATFGVSVPEALQTGTLFFLGMLIGASFFGRLADRFGRRRVLLVTVICDAIFGLLSVFAPNLFVLFLLRFLTGMAVGGTLPVDYAMMAEFLPARNRGRWLVMLEGFWAVGTVAVALAAWIASVYVTSDAWRWIFAATAVPALIGIFLRFWVPESPLHLQRTGQTGELRRTLNRMLRVNGKSELAEGDTVASSTATSGGSIFSPSLRRRTLSILCVWLLVSVSYYGVFTWLPGRLAEQGFGYVRGYGFLVIVALAQLPGYALAAYGVEAIGRKPTLIGFLLLSAAGCVLFFLATDVLLIGGAILLMSFALLGTWGALYAFTPELFPTALRGTGMGAAGSVARFGGLLAPSALAIIIAQDFSLAIALFAGLLLLGAVAASFVDTETRNALLT